MNKKKLYVMRGVAGSGKSFIARKLAGSRGVICSADDSHLDPETGEYNWKPERVKFSHQECRNKALKCVKNGVPIVIIDNTNIKRWEMFQLKPVILLAIEHNYEIIIKEPDPTWYFYKTAFNSEKLFQRNLNTHRVPLETIKKMIEDYVPNITVKDILE